MRGNMKAIGACATMVLGAVTLVLAGCAAPQPATSPVKDAITNPDAYLTVFGNSSATAIAPVSAAEPALPFRRMEVIFNVTETPVSITSTTAVRTGLTIKRVLTPGSAPGEIRSYDVWSNNGIPFRYNFFVTYRGLVVVKWQYMYVNRANAEPLGEMRAFQQFETLTRPSLASAQYSYTNRPTPPATGPDQSGRFACTFGANLVAEIVHKNLVGDATDLSCDIFGANGAISMKETFVYLRKYGIVIPLEVHSSSYTNVYKATSVRVDWDGGSTQSMR
jgi:hypothetical protein